MDSASFSRVPNWSRGFIQGFRWQSYRRPGFKKPGNTIISPFLFHGFLAQVCGGPRDASPDGHDVAAQVKFESKIRKQLITFKFQAFSFRRFQLVFDRVNLHRPTRRHMTNHLAYTWRWGLRSCNSPAGRARYSGMTICVKPLGHLATSSTKSSKWSVLIGRAGTSLTQ